jgi:DNA modification methylase
MSDFDFMQEIKATPSPARLAILPVSVLEIGSGGKHSVRGESDHDSDSSRKGFSPFPFEVAEICVSLYLRGKSHIVDPFAGWGERGEAMNRHNMRYTGYDISEEAIKTAWDIFGVKNTLADSKNVEVPEHDGLITCPPYWGLEKYASEDGLDKIKSWKGFLSEYANIFERFAKKAKSGSKYAIMTGDWRDDGKYYDLTFQTEMIMHSLGFEPFDKIVVSRLSISKIKIMLPQAKRLGYSVKVHESLNVFIKP